MTKNEREHLEKLEECFDQLRSVYNDAQDEIKELNAYIEILKELCNENYVTIPPLHEPVPF